MPNMCGQCVSVTTCSSFLGREQPPALPCRMQALWRQATLEFSMGLSAAVAVWAARPASSPACPDCTCTPTLYCAGGAASKVCESEDASLKFFYLLIGVVVGAVSHFFWIRSVASEPSGKGTYRRC